MKFMIKIVSAYLSEDKHVYIQSFVSIYEIFVIHSYEVQCYFQFKLHHKGLWLYCCITLKP